MKRQKLADFYTEANITPNIRLIKMPQKLYEKMRLDKQIPMLVEHQNKAFQPLAKVAKTIFPQQRDEPKQVVEQKKIEITRREWIVYTIPDQAFYDAVLLVILKMPFEVEVDKTKQTLSFLKKDETKVKNLLNDFKTSHKIRIKR